MSELEPELSLFEKLKAIRVNKEIELSHIADKSRIQLKYLEAIEEGSLDNIPRVYDKLFFSTYLDSLQVSAEDKEQFEEEFRKLRKEITPSYTTTVRQIKPQEYSGISASFLKKLYIGIPVLLVVVLIIFMIINSTGVDMETGNDVQEISVTKIAETIEKAGKEKAQADSLEKSSTQAAETKENCIVILSAVERTWLRAITDGKDTTDVTMKQGNNITIKAQNKISFLVGNAAGIDFTINGKKEGVLGKSGEVIVNLIVTPDGIAAKQIKKPKINVEEEANNDSLNNN